MKLKKIVSLALAGILAVSMLTACGDGATDPTPDNDENVVTSAAIGKSAVFQAALKELEDDDDSSAFRKITMSDSSSLNQALEAASMNVGTATIADFTTALRAAAGGRTVACFDGAGNVWFAVNGTWGPVTGVAAGDLAEVADEMEALSVLPAFATLVPDSLVALDETVTMLFAVDTFIGQDAAVRQVAAALAPWIAGLQIDNDNAIAANDATTLHYEYTGSVSLMNRSLADSHDMSGMGINIIAVEITRTAKA